MRVNIANWRPKWLPSLHDPGPAHLWRIGYALAACFAIAVAGLVGLWLAARALLGNPPLASSKGITVRDSVGVAQLVFASVAGAGALVALVVAYRRQRVAEVATIEDKDRWETTAEHDRTRVFNERFTAIAAQLGDVQPAVRLAGVHAMAGLADDWTENRQTCVDVLCAYLRLPYDTDPGEDGDPPGRAFFGAYREVRHSVIRLITAHLRPDAKVSWQGLDLDFTGVVFDGGDFGGAEFSGGQVHFRRAQFSRGQVYFTSAKFSGSEVDFTSAKFSGGQVYFRGAEFTGGQVYFRGAVFTGGWVDFSGADFSGSEVDFRGAEFYGGRVDFGGAKFSSGTVGFSGADFSSSEVYFRDAEFSGGRVDFSRAEFSGGRVDFSRAKFSGGRVDFSRAKFSGGQVDFSRPRDWSQPPGFAWVGGPPEGVLLPVDADAAPT